MRGLSQSVWAHEDHLVAIYRRTGDTSFTHREIADLIPCGCPDRAAWDCDQHLCLCPERGAVPED
jgi:hypothetical protein